MEIDDLTPIAQDYLKVIWSAVEWGEPPITTKALAERFATSQANVSGTMRRLEAQDLVSYEPYKPVVLTELGQRLALGMVRRHRLIETFLAQVLGYGWEEVHEDAERLEHAASERFLTRIDEILSHPTTDPHGDPIPTADGRWESQAGAIRLAEAEPGGYRVARVDDSDPGRLSRLRVLRVAPGVRLVVSDRRSAIALADGTPIELVPDDLDAVRVRPDGGAAPQGSPPAVPD